MEVDRQRLTVLVLVTVVGLLSARYHTQTHQIVSIAGHMATGAFGAISVSLIYRNYNRQKKISRKTKYGVMMVFAVITATVGQTIQHVGLVEGDFLIRSIIEGLIAGIIVAFWEWKDDREF